ncbi:hypothetical protein Acr_00g0061130 [Actinidia rufa]|uniref:Uncharacterized protein n=1 Tax=Actinidia rufa TaxID=165716 RepID=A0A7J0DQK7_9ERIC|nr:hypothetical protein Acr_00g0061130 [Actinidia rufa]
MLKVELNICLLEKALSRNSPSKALEGFHPHLSSKKRIFTKMQTFLVKVPSLHFNKQISSSQFITSFSVANPESTSLVLKGKFLTPRSHSRNLRLSQTHVAVNASSTKGDPLQQRVGYSARPHDKPFWIIKKLIEQCWRFCHSIEECEVRIMNLDRLLQWVTSRVTHNLACIIEDVTIYYPSKGSWVFILEYQSQVMGTNKERLEQLEAGLGGVQDGLHRMELGMADRLRHLEETLNRLSDVFFPNQEAPNHGNQYREGHNGGRLVVSSKMAKLEFPRFSGDDPTKWPTSGGNGFAGHYKRKDVLSRGQILKTNSGLALGLRSAKILMKLFHRSDRLAPCANTSGNLNNWAIGSEAGRKRLCFARMKDDQLERQRRFIRPASPVRAPLDLPPANQAAPLAPMGPVRRLDVKGYGYSCWRDTMTTTTFIHNDVTEEQHAVLEDKDPLDGGSNVRPRCSERALKPNPKRAKKETLEGNDCKELGIPLAYYVKPADGAVHVMMNAIKPHVQVLKEDGSPWCGVPLAKVCDYREDQLLSPSLGVLGRTKDKKYAKKP